MDKTAELILDGKTCKVPIVEGTEKEKGIDISSLRDNTGYITLDDGYGNTGSCQSQITFIDGEKGILRYRGIPIEELAEKSTFIEAAHLIIMGKLPNRAELRTFSELLTQNELLHESMKHHFEGFPANAHPMAILSSMINATSCFYPELLGPQMRENFQLEAARLLSQVRTIAAFAYRKSRGLPIIYPRPTLKYTANFLHMMFSQPYENYDPRAKIIKAACDDVLAKLHKSDPLLDIAKHLEEAALRDSYFIERKLYPNVDFYSGIIMRALGIPVEMFTVIFAIGRMPGWIANYKEVMESGQSRIYRPRQIYTGPTLNHYTPMKERG